MSVTKAYVSVEMAPYISAIVRCERERLKLSCTNFKTVSSKPATLFSISSMPFSLLKNCLRENSQCIDLEEGAQQRPDHSMNRGADLLDSSRQAPGVGLEAEAVKDRQYGVVARILKHLPGDVLCQFQLAMYGLGGAAQIGAAHLLLSLLVVAIRSFCSVGLRSAIRVSRYVMTTLCNRQQQTNTFGA